MLRHERDVGLCYTGRLVIEILGTLGRKIIITSSRLSIYSQIIIGVVAGFVIWKIGYRKYSGSYKGRDVSMQDGA